MENKIPIKVDDNLDLGYEKTAGLVYYFLFLPVMFFTTAWVALKKLLFGSELKINAFWFDGLSPACHEIKENATTWRALDIIYNYLPPKNFSLSERVTYFWNNLSSVRATRNRLKLAKYCLRKEIERLLNNSSEVRIISVASGSAQGVIDIMKEFKEKNINIKAKFLDLDKTALEHSKKLAEQAGIKDKIIFVNKSAKHLEEIAKEFRPQIIEVVGFIMYRPDERVIKLIERIYRILPRDGILLISQDNHVIEKFFLYYVANWPLIFRSPKKFTELLIKGGFNPKNCKIVYEPLKMHGIAICRKTI